MKTVTTLEYLPTTVSDFNLQVLFANGTSSNVSENTDSGLGWNDPTRLKLGSSNGTSALFGLSSDSRLRLESEGKVSTLKQQYGNLKLPCALAFIPETETQNWSPIGFHITDINKNNNTIVHAVSVSPFIHTLDVLWRIAEHSLYNMTVVVTCDEGLCIGTPNWQNKTFDAGNKTSKDGRYELVQLQAVPVY